MQPDCDNIRFSREVQIGPLSSAYITVTGTAGVCPGNQYVYTANPPYGHQSNYTYSWTYPSGWFVEGQMDDWIRLRVPLYNPNYGTVRVSVTNECGPSGYTGITVYPGWGCGGYYSVFPNPSAYEIEIIANSQDEQGENDKVTVILLDETNRIALKDEISRNGGIINVSRLRKGSYIMQIIDQNNKSIFRAHILIE